MRKLTEVTDQEWESFNKWNRQIVEKFIRNRQSQLSPQTLKQYMSGLRHWLRWIHNELGDDVEIHKMKVRHGEDYITYLDEAGLSPAGVRFKVAAASTLCKYIIRNYGDDEYPRFKNIFDGAEKPPKGEIREKNPMNPEEYQLLIKTLEDRGEWQMIAYVKFTYATSARRAEVRQILKEIAEYEKHKSRGGEEKDYYQTHNVRCKGRGKKGNVRPLKFNDEAMEAIKKWLSVRGDDECPYLFVVKTSKGKVSPVSETTFNYWCKEIFSKIVGRRVHPHQFREQRATDLVVLEGKDIRVAQKLLGHASSQTTEIYVIRDAEDDLDEAF